jgi:hypothetical protein
VEVLVAEEVVEEVGEVVKKQLSLQLLQLAMFLGHHLFLLQKKINQQIHIQMKIESQ